MTKPKWKYALCQHPMWLLIAEDTVCAERTPPWGSPSIEEYGDCLARSLESLEEHPELLLNWDFSAVELEDFTVRRPDLMRRMRKLTDEGRIAFLNGTYSQPHLQMLSIESAVRQFEHGLSVIEDQTGYRVRCYAAQEPGITSQLPQILRAFGYETASTPDFPFGIRLIDGHVQHWQGRYQWLEGDDLLDWLGQDGTTIPTWLKTSGCPNQIVLADDAQHGLLNTTRLRVDMPDMVEIDRKWVEERAAVSELVKLDDHLAEFSRTRTDRARAVLDANYAYAEGADAEELSRANTRAEAALLRLETLTALLPVEDKPPFDLDAAWKTILKAQHHDAYWTGAPELRAKSIGWLVDIEAQINEAARRLLRRLGSDMPETPEGTKAVVAAYTYPAPHLAHVEFEVENETDKIVGDDGGPCTFQTRRCSDGTVKATVLGVNEGIGFSTFLVRPDGGKAVEPSKLRGSYTFSNPFYSATLDRNGTIGSVQAEKVRVLKGGESPWMCVRDGMDVRPTPVRGSATIERGPVYEAVESSAELGEIAMTTRITFSHIFPSFDIETELDFREPTEIGDYFDDRTKLHLAWNVGRDVEVKYLCGGCPEIARPGKSFIAYPALAVSGKHGGFSICLDSVAKCWLDNGGVLRCVIAWGRDGDHFHNRQGPLPGIMGPLAWLKPMDLRLRGKHVMRHTIRPHSGGPVPDHDLIAFAVGASCAPIATTVETGGDELPWWGTAISLQTEELTVLSIRPAPTGATMRLLNSNPEDIAPKLRLARGWRMERPRLLNGKRVRTIPPYGIAEIDLTRE